ncbi:15809_t:CDS:2, partial [Gigaspora margarita]
LKGSKKVEKFKVETRNFINYIEIEILEELPEIIDQEYPELDRNMRKLASYDIQRLIKYKENSNYNETAYFAYNPCVQNSKNKIMH